MGTTITSVKTRMEFDLVAVEGVFRRGDANDDGRVDLSDPVMILGCKFLGQRCPTCRDTGDANDDGRLDVSDGVYLLNFLFQGGPAPGVPGPVTCGADRTDDPFPDCVYTSC